MFKRSWPVQRPSRRWPPTPLAAHVEDRMMCGRCIGTGRVSRPDSQLLAAAISETLMPCPVCHGAGSVLQHH